MPENKMILLIEGQRPIFGEKLRFFQTQPFKSAEAFSQAQIPQVPDIEYLPPKAVPATTPEYARAGDPSVEVLSPKPAEEEKLEAAATIAPVAAKLDVAPVENAAPTAKRTVNKNALRPNPKSAPAKTGAAASASLAATEARIKAIEDGLTPKAAQLKATVEMKVEKLGGKSPTARRNYMDIFNTTIPDPVEVGVSAE